MEKESQLVQLNLSVVALVALVAIVGMVTLVANKPVEASGLADAGVAENVGGEARTTPFAAKVGEACTVKSQCVCEVGGSEKCTKGKCVCPYG